MHRTSRIPIIMLVFVLVFALAASAQNRPAAVYKDGPVRAKMIDAEFHYSDSNYHAICNASDGNVYYVICSHNKKSGAKMFKYDPRSGRNEEICDFTDYLGYDRTKVINQGKVHSDLYEVNGKLYFGTHAGAWDQTYPGGHFMSYDLDSGEFTDYGIGVQADGLVALTMDPKNMRMYAVSWPGYLFLCYDIKTDEVKIWGKRYAPVEEQGPRSIGVDPRTGDVFWHNTDDTIERFDFDTEVVRPMEKPRFNGNMFLVPFGEGNYNVNHVWRNIRWSDALNKFVGVMYNSDWLFAFDPETEEIEIIDRIASGPNRKSGFTIYSSLAFELTPDGRTAYYIAHNKIDPSDTESNETELHLVTYDLVDRHYTDHGPLVLEDGRKPRYCQGVEIGHDGNIYIVAWVVIKDKNSEAYRERLRISRDGKPAPELEIERSRDFQEINLMIMKDPLAR